MLWDVCIRWGIWLLLFLNFSGLASEQPIVQKAENSGILKKFVAIEANLDSSEESRVIKGLQDLNYFVGLHGAESLDAKDYRYIYQKIPRGFFQMPVSLKMEKELYLLWQKMYQSKFYQAGGSWKDLLSGKGKKIWPMGSDQENLNHYKGMAVRYTDSLQKQVNVTLRQLDEAMQADKFDDLELHMKNLAGLAVDNKPFLQDSTDLLFQDLHLMFTKACSWLAGMYQEKQPKLSWHFRSEFVHRFGALAAKLQNLFTAKKLVKEMAKLGKSVVMQA